MGLSLLQIGFYLSSADPLISGTGVSAACSGGEFVSTTGVAAALVVVGVITACVAGSSFGATSGLADITGAADAATGGSVV